MFFKKLIVFCAFFTMAFCLNINNANAKYCNSYGSKVGAGKFCDNLVEKSCPAGCYCTGGGNISWVIGDVGKGCSGRWSKMSDLSGKGVYLCPSPFTKSDGGASANTSCYYTNSSGTKLYNKNYSCGAGQYLAANSITCTTCPKNYYCPGVKTKPSGSDAGKTACPSGTKSELGAKSSSDCKKHISCSAGQYLPANTETCAACTNGYYCTAGTYTKKAENQGLKVCGTEQVPNASKTGCETKKYSCDTGTYLPANSTTCSACPSDSYCPGQSDMVKSDSPQGFIQCTDNKVPKSDHTGCEEKKPDSVKCNVGQYLPANTYACAACLANSACAGGTFAPSNANQGIKACDSGYSVSADKASCVKNKPTSVNCDPGTYLPAGKEACAPCTSGFVCTGGDLPYSETSDSGISKCPSGQVPTSDQTKCENAPPETVKCAAKQYLPANKDKCAPCLERHTCPGGDYVPSNKDQGIQKTAEIALDWDRMRYGLKTADAPLKEQCWILIDKKKYIDCVLGKKSINIKNINISDTVKEKLLSNKSEISNTEAVMVDLLQDFDTTTAIETNKQTLDTSGTTPLQIQSVSLK